jgi:hypothetical protein
MWHVLGRAEVHTGPWWANLMDIDYLEDLSANGEGIFKTDIQEAGWRWGKDWIHLAQDKDRWRTLVNAVMNLRVP